MNLLKMALLSSSLSVAQWIERPLCVSRTAIGSNYFAIVTNITSFSRTGFSFDSSAFGSI